MKSRWMGPLVAAAMWAFALAVYADLPQRIPTHWGWGGEPDRWGDKRWAAFLAPAIATFTLALPWIRRIDPRRRNYERWEGEMRLLITLLVLFLALLEVLSLGVALGWPVNVGSGIVAGVGLLLVGVGNYLPRIRSNWWMGIRTPWTMDSERVWRDTHRVGGRVFVACGLVMAAAALLPGPARAWVAGTATATLTVVPIVYSYLAWRRHGREDAA